MTLQSESEAPWCGPSEPQNFQDTVALIFSPRPIQVQGGEDTGVHLRMERETQDLWPQNGEGAYRVAGASELEEVCSMYKTLG